MKNIFRLLFSAIVVTSLFASCDKKQDLVTFNDGKAVVLSSSNVAIAPAVADSNNVAATFSWTDPGYAVDSSAVKYILQIDSSGRNFSHAYEKQIIADRDTSFLNKELNAIALSFGFAFNTAYDMDVRVISSYPNNNEQYTSNTVKINFTPYKVPPKVALPTSGKLFLVGDASQGGWNNPVPTPSQEFAKIDETTFGGVFNLLGGKQYLALPVNGDWGHKFSVSNSSAPVTGGDFGYDLSTNFNGPATDGWYTIILNFQTGKYSVTPYTGSLPTDLFIVGDATNGGWNNPVPTPTQQFTRLNSSEFTLSLPLIGGKQ
ncbi:MAG: SusE domain-containing protein, partial [Bacteroidota bacterium]